MQHPELLEPGRARALTAQALTYPYVGRTAANPPDGYSYFSRSRVVRTDESFEAVAARLRQWQVHTRAGLHLAVSSLTVETDAVVVIRVGIGPVAIEAPCRVVYVVDEADLQGFAYGTLPGHPETGEERFLLRRTANDDVEFTIEAFSRPHSRAARMAGPAGRAGQRLMTTRYLRALDSA